MSLILKVYCIEGVFAQAVGYEDSVCVFQEVEAGALIQFEVVFIVETACLFIFGTGVFDVLWREGVWSRIR